MNPCLRIQFSVLTDKNTCSEGLSCSDEAVSQANRFHLLCVHHPHRQNSADTHFSVHVLFFFIFFGVPSVSSDPGADVQDRNSPRRGSVPETGALLRPTIGSNSSMCCSHSGSPSSGGRGAFDMET